MSLQIVRLCMLDAPSGVAPHPADLPNFHAVLEDLLLCPHRFALEKRLTDAASDAGYFSTLPVSFDYWHYGRHAEHASSQGMKRLGELFAAAWAIEHELLDAADELGADILEAKRIEFRQRFAS